jgi:hypothetical protein
LLEWFLALIENGPKYGYYPEPSKSYLVVHPKFVEHAKILFAGFNINIVTGSRFLGGFIGSIEDTNLWIEEKVLSWNKAISKLASAATNFPQAAFTALTRSLQNEWLFVQRVLNGFEHQFSLLKDSLKSDFLPNLFGC